VYRKGTSYEEKFPEKEEEAKAELPV